MSRALRTVFTLVLGCIFAVLTTVATPLPAHAAPLATTPVLPAQSAAGCPARVAVLGADMSAGGRFEVQGLLGVGAHTTQLIETLADEEQQARGLVPQNLLRAKATSSALIAPLAGGLGLSVRVNPAIVLDTPQTYANALLTAGVYGASVGVAAPTSLSEHALGTTAFLGLLRAARAACLTIPAARENLAIREVVLTSHLAQIIGRGAAPRLMAALKADVATRHAVTDAAVSNIVVRDSAARTLRVPPEQFSALVSFLRDLALSGVYDRIPTAQPRFTALSRLANGSQALALRFDNPAALTAPPRVTPKPSPSAVAVTPRASTPGAATPGPTTGAGTAAGALQSVGAGTIVLTEGAVARTYTLSPNVVVDRNAQRSSIGALQPRDHVSMTIDDRGKVIYISATSVTASAGATPAAGKTTAAVPTTAAAAGSGLDTASFAALAALVLLLLLALPLIAAFLVRRRQRSAAAKNEVTTEEQIVAAPLTRMSSSPPPTGTESSNVTPRTDAARGRNVPRKIQKRDRDE